MVNSLDQSVEDEEDETGSEWVVVIHGEDDGEGFEISVCIDHTHGCHSWGWSGPDKIILDGGNPEDNIGFKRLEQLAYKLAEALNGGY